MNLSSGVLTFYGVNFYSNADLDTSTFIYDLQYTPTHGTGGSVTGIATNNGSQVFGRFKVPSPDEAYTTTEGGGQFEPDIGIEIINQNPRALVKINETYTGIGGNLKKYVFTRGFNNNGAVLFMKFGTTYKVCYSASLLTTTSSIIIANWCTGSVGGSETQINLVWS